MSQSMNCWPSSFFTCGCLAGLTRMTPYYGALLFMFLYRGVGGGSDQQLAAHEPARLLGPGVGKECVGRAALDHAAAMHEHDLAGEAPRFAEIVRRHHHLDPARSNDADDVLDRLGRGRVEARGRLVEQKNLRLFGESARERQPLLL